MQNEFFSQLNLDLKVEVVLGPKAKMPTQGTPGSAGFDLSSADDSFILKPEEIKIVSTQLKMSIPNGWYGRICPRSGLALKNGIDVLAGVIDSDYTGDIGVILINLGKKDVVINQFDKIAQIIFQKYEKVNFKQALLLSPTQRNGGFGSTGN